MNSTAGSLPCPVLDGWRRLRAMERTSPETERDEFAEDGGEGPAEGEASSLQDDLLAASESLYHREVSHFQQTQHQRMMASEQATATWAKEEREKGGSPIYVDWLCAEHLRKVRGTLHAETQEVIRAEAWRRATRDNAIMLFCSRQ